MSLSLLFWTLTVKMSPFRVFVAYLLVICASALAFYLLPNLFQEPLSFLDSVYFSVVTITTLGYGDISPVSDLGKLLAAAEALLGVLLLGLFLMAASHRLVEKQEAKRVRSAKENIKTQYRYWREDTLMALLFLSGLGSVSSDLSHRLRDVSEFRDYFSENRNERWYAAANSLSSESHYTRELIRGIELLQHHIETFIALVSITELAVLQTLTQHVDSLSGLRGLDMDDYDDQKKFIGGLWNLMALSDAIYGLHEYDHFLKTIDDA